MSARKILLAGLPSSGKTTFLAAFWHAVNEPSRAASLRLDRLKGDWAYMNYVRDSWLQLKEVARTSSASEHQCTIFLRAEDQADAMELVVPDFAGESFERFLSMRLWTEEFSKLARELTGMLLFVHPRVLVPHRLIWDVEQSVPYLTGDDDTADGIGVTDEEEWAYEKIPTQVCLVDLLQEILGVRAYEPPTRIAVIISAWDLLAGDFSDPERWLSETLPLLHQYLDSNSGRITWNSFGVSAQGGDLVKDRKCLEELSNANERVQIVSSESTTSDITLPLQWLLDV